MLIVGTIDKTLYGQMDLRVRYLLYNLHEINDSHKINFNEVKMKTKLFL